PRARAPPPAPYRGDHRQEHADAAAERAGQADLPPPGRGRGGGARDRPQEDPLPRGRRRRLDRRHRRRRGGSRPARGRADRGERPGQANSLRLFVGQVALPAASDRVWVLETNLDDLPGEIVGYTTEQLMKAGALDTFLTPIQMKKNRPGVMVTVLCDESRIEP